MPSMGPATESTHLDASGWDPALNRGVGTQADPSVMDAPAYSEMLCVYADFSVDAGMTIYCTGIW